MSGYWPVTDSVAVTRKFGSGEHSDLDSVGRRFVSSLTGEVAIGNEIDDLDALVGGWANRPKGGSGRDVSRNFSRSRGQSCKELLDCSVRRMPGDDAVFVTKIHVGPGRRRRNG